MREAFREAWDSVRKAETMLVQAGVRLRPKDAPSLRDGLEIDRALRPLFARAAYGFDPRKIRAGDYLMRYPFSSAGVIERQFRSLVDAGVLTGPHGGPFALTEVAEAQLLKHTERVGESIDRLDLGAVGEEKIQTLLAYDHRILDGIRESVERAPSPIFEHRLKGVHPEYDPPKRWHHWQLAWTMVAAHEDAEEQVRKKRGIAPLVWFARHEFWFTARLPHRSRMRTCADLRAAAERYAPLENPEQTCRGAIEAMRAQDWLEGEGAASRLSDEQLALADRDEAEIETIFLSRWPDFTDQETRELKGIADAINRRCEDLLARAEEDP
jgi:hypothetical protein